MMDDKTKVKQQSLADCHGTDWLLDIRGVPKVNVRRALNFRAGVGIVTNARFPVYTFTTNGNGKLPSFLKELRQSAFLARRQMKSKFCVSEWRYNTRFWIFREVRRIIKARCWDEKLRIWSESAGNIITGRSKNERRLCGLLWYWLQITFKPIELQCFSFQLTLEVHKV